MAVFGTIKRAGEDLRVDINEWLGTDYFSAAMAGAAGLFAEEATNAFVVNKFGLTGNKELLYKTVHRLVFSAIYYFGGKKLNKPQLGLVASMMTIVMILVDALNYLLKVQNPQQAGESLATRFSRIARASYSAPSLNVKAYTTPANASVVLVNATVVCLKKPKLRALARLNLPCCTTKFEKSKTKRGGMCPLRGPRPGLKKAKLRGDTLPVGVLHRFENSKTKRARARASSPRKPV